MSSIDYPVQFFLKALLVALGSEEKKLCFDDFPIDYTCICLCGESFDLLNQNSEKPVGEIN